MKLGDLVHITKGRAFYLSNKMLNHSSSIGIIIDKKTDASGKYLYKIFWPNHDQYWYFPSYIELLRS